MRRLLVWLAAGLLTGLRAQEAAAPARPANPGVFDRAADERDTRELLVQATELNYAGTAEDDVFFLAGRANLSGTFEDDVMGATSAQARFTGTAREDVRLGSLQGIVFNGTGGKSVTLWGGTIELSTNAVVKGDATLSGGAVTCTGRVDGDLTLEGAESATLKGRVGGTVRITSPDIVILPGTTIGGDLVVSGAGDLALPEGVTLGGRLRQETDGGTALAGVRQQALLVLLITLAFTGLAVALVQLGVMPLSTQIAAQLLRVSWPQCLMSGGLILGASMLLAIAGFKLGLGMIFSLVVLSALTLLLFTGQTAMALMLGHRLAGSRPIRSWPVLAALTVLGLVVVQLAFFVPVVGTSLWLLLNFQGAGAMFAHLRQTQRGAALAAHQIPPPPARPGGGTDA